MRAQLREAIAILCMGRSRKAVIAELAMVCAAVPVLWLMACAFVLLESLP